MFSYSERTAALSHPPTLRQASRGQPSMEEIFLFRWGLGEGAPSGKTEEEYNVVWRASRATPTRPTFVGGNQIWQSCVKILICLERIFFGTVFLRGMEMGGDSGVSVVYIPNIWSQWRKFSGRRGIMKRCLAVKRSLLWAGSLSSEPLWRLLCPSDNTHSYFITISNSYLTAFWGPALKLSF